MPTTATPKGDGGRVAQAWSGQPAPEASRAPGPPPTGLRHFLMPGQTDPDINSLLAEDISALDPRAAPGVLSSAHKAARNISSLRTFYISQLCIPNVFYGQRVSNHLNKIPLYTENKN